MEHLVRWEGFAYAYPERNRHAGSAAHNDTLRYIWNVLNETRGYYDVVKQPFHDVVRVSGATVLRMAGRRDISGWSMSWAVPGRL